VIGRRRAIEKREQVGDDVRHAAILRCGPEVTTRGAQRELFLG
jgi:hypothetical protein